ATYLTRVGGYVFITRMKRIPPRAEAALNAVPAAVLTTLVAPAAVTGGFDVSVTMAIAFLLGLRLSLLPVLAIGWVVVMVLRQFIG
ncbi:MAG: AzlD domain-containing protein, partial [Proteobacteria bacterium]|nr:AzlD domain-containing protein [Pseudomonadota bacterium]